MKEKVGTELGKLIPAWAVKSGAKCACKDVAAKMDKMGVSGCIKHKDWIIAHLLAQDEHLIPALKFVPETLKRASASVLLGKAIRNARNARKASQA
jgi:hypothetical protein